MASTAIPLVVACGERDYALVKALIEGPVQVPGCSVSFARLAPGEMLFRSFDDPAFNVAELSLSNYVTRVAEGTCAYMALPVYISRTFPHPAIYVRMDRDLRSPRSLRGRRVGINEYQHTIYTWTRAILEDQYGVSPKDIHWVSVSAAGEDKHDVFKAPPGVTIEHLRTPKTLSDLLEEGSVDAIVSARPPACFDTPNIGRLFPNYAAAQDDYYARTGIFPILHVMGIRASLLDRHPELAQYLYTAFGQAREAALEPGRAQIYTYGLGEKDRRTLDFFLTQHYRQGLSRRRLDISELFVAGQQ